MSDTEKNPQHPYDQAWLMAYLCLTPKKILPHPKAKDRCFYCGAREFNYVVEIVVDHLAALDFRNGVPIDENLNSIRALIQQSGVTAMKEARHLVTTCPECHIKIMTIGWCK